MEDLQRKKVVELRKEASSLGVKPLPSKKLDLINSILKAKGLKPTSKKEKAEKKDDPIRNYTMKQLRDICMQYKYRLSFDCGGGVTKKSLYEGLARAGLLEGVVVPEPANKFAEEIRKRDPDFYERISTIVPKLPDTRKLFSVRQERESGDAPWLPWLEVHREYNVLMLAHETGSPPEIARVFDFLTTEEENDAGIIEDIRRFAEKLPLLSYIYALLSMDFLTLCTQGGIDRPFEISEAISSPSKKIVKPKVIEKALAGDVLVEEDFDLNLFDLPEDVRYEIMHYIPFSSYTKLGHIPNAKVHVWALYFESGSAHRREVDGREEE